MIKQLSPEEFVKEFGLFSLEVIMEKTEEAIKREIVGVDIQHGVVYQSHSGFLIDNHPVYKHIDVVSEFTVGEDLQVDHWSIIDVSVADSEMPDEMLDMYNDEKMVVKKFYTEEP